MFINISINNTSDLNTHPFRQVKSKFCSLPFKPFPQVFADKISLKQ